MRLILFIFLALPSCFLVGLTIDDLGKTGNNIMHLLGAGFLFLAIFMINKINKTKKIAKQDLS